MLKRRWQVIVGTLALVSLISGTLWATIGSQQSAHASPQGTLSTAFASAAQQYGVPEQVLLAVSYAETQWNAKLASTQSDVDSNGNAVAGESVYGPMSLYLEPDQSGTVAQAAADLGVSMSQVESDPATNILGAAAVLSDDSKATNNGNKPTSSDLKDWYGAVAKYVGNGYYQPTKEFADHVFSIVQNGVQGKASDGETLSVQPQSVNPNTNQINVLNLTHLTNSPSDYPGGYWTPAGGKHYGAANRPKDGLFIQYIVIHDTEEDYPGTIRSFSNPGGCCSSHYVVDGVAQDQGVYPAVTQMVHNKDIAYHAGNYWINQHSIGIEDVGFADNPNGYYTQAMYDANAKLVAYLCAVYNIPINRSHILEHGTVQGPTQAYVHGMHWDPGPFWDWPYWESQVVYYYENVWTNHAALPAGSEVPTITATNPTIREITAGSAFAAAGDIPTWETQGHAEFTSVYADNGGTPSSQLILGASDPSTWVSPSQYNTRDWSCDNLPDATQNANGTWTEDTNSDQRAKADYGEEVAVLATYTDASGVQWDKINFNGVVGWIHASDTASGTGSVVTFGNTTKLYGSPILSNGYTVCSDAANGFSRVGQSYVAQASYTNASSGITWYEIFYNHRIAWAPASEVTVS